MKTAGSTANVIDEDVLQRTIERGLERGGFAEPGYKVRVMVRNGVVHLSGNVRYENEIAVVDAFVSEFVGVGEVINRILYREGPPQSAAVSIGKESRR